MSTYNKLTKNPKTGEFENATWMDDYFGRHHYGVRFPGGEVIDPDKVELETMDMPDNTKKEICTSCKDGKMHLCTVHYSYIDKNKEEKLEFHGIKVIKDETKREGEWELKHTPFPQPESKEEVCPCGGKIVEGKCTRPVVNLEPPLSEDWEKEFKNFVSINELYLMGAPVGKIKALFDERTTQAYELGKQDTLDMVMREIEDEDKRWNENGEHYANVSQALSTLKQKLSGNGE